MSERPPDFHRTAEIEQAAENRPPVTIRMERERVVLGEKDPETARRTAQVLRHEGDQFDVPGIEKPLTEESPTVSRVPRRVISEIGRHPALDLGDRRPLAPGALLFPTAT